MVDIIQASFGPTFRTGMWPQRFRSHAARVVAGAVSAKLLAAGIPDDGDAATRLLDIAGSWENPVRTFAEAIVPQLDDFVACMD
ncbi:MAG: hypothetical protein FWD73_04755 [Polyangiaceae bacterium]|nr:hypothetical protein [Polyangiaceae bacterium]